VPLAFSHGASCGVQFCIGRKRFANLPLVSHILFSNNGVRRMTTTRQFDGINRLTQIANTGETGSTRVYLDRTAVAQIASLPYRGLPIRDRTKKCTISRLPVGDAAGCQPAPPACRTRGAVVPAKCARSTLSSSMGGSFWPYQYDAPDWRTRQMTSDGSSGTWVLTEDLKFVSEPLLFGRHAMDLNASNNVAVRTYVWGLDLPETLEGAGGVRGLLWVTLHTGSGPAAGTHFCAYDGNGNIVALSAASDGSATGRYEYGPFGEPIRMTGPAAPLDPFRFSTKRTCNTTDLVLYEYRVYKPSIGRWANRDPIEEEGGLNLYAYVGNDPVNEFDPLGLLAGAPLPAPPPTLPPPIGTPKPGPPIVTICTVAFCVVYTCTAYACEKTGVHDKLGDLIYKCRNRKSALEKCKDDCYDSYLSDVAFCKGVRTKRQREYRYRQAFKLYVDCLKGCEKEHGGR